MSLLGLDIGTTGCKAIVFSVDGTPLGTGYREYPLRHPRPGWMELDPDEVWEAVKASVSEAVRHAGPEDPVRAVAPSCQGECCVPVDEKGAALAFSPVTFDGRTVPQAERWAQEMGAEAVFERTGMPLHPMYTLNKVLWWKENEPELFDRAWKFLCYGDFALHRFGGAATIDWSMAGRTMAFDPRAADWSVEMLSRAGVSHSKFAPAKPSGTRVGRIYPEVAAELGLPEHVALVTGGHDQPCGALGAGVSEPGVAMDATGTVECITAVFDHPVLTPEMRENNFCCYRHVAPELFATLAFNFTGGALLRWYRDTLGAKEVEEARVTGLDVYDVMLGKASSGPASVLVLPHFTMTGTPWFDPHARGAIVGLTLATTTADLIKGILDGVTYEMRVNLERLETAGVRVDHLRAIGGGARSRKWLQLKANIFNRPVSALNVSEAACLGAAMLAGVGIGEYESAGEAAEALVAIQETFEPDTAEVERYSERYELYKQLYPAVKPIAHGLTAATVADA